MDIVTATAIAAFVLNSVEGDTSRAVPPMPEYVTVLDKGDIGFLVKSFDQVKEWAEYLEVPYSYMVQKVAKEGDMPFAFGTADYKSTHWVGIQEKAYTLHVYHNERIVP